MEYSADTAGGVFKYEIEENGVCLSGFGGHIFELIIPDCIEDKPVIAVKKKAFMSAKSLKRVSLPSTVKSIGDYAFSACSLLEDFEIRNGADENIVWGQSVFSKSTSLFSLNIWTEQSSKLVALSATIMDAQYLLNDRDSFYKQFDARLLSIIRTADDEGFVFMVLCGEEDLTADIDEFKEEARRKKSYMAASRLIYDFELEKNNRDLLTDYLKTHTCGCSSDAAFRVLLNNSQYPEYQNLLFELDLINESNFEQVLTELSDRYPVLKAKVICNHEVTSDLELKELEL